jgi:hypothetical protein
MWERVETVYNTRSTSEGRKVRNAKFLKGQYVVLVKSRKPTGDPERPAEVIRAHEIEKAIEERIFMVSVEDTPEGLSETDNYHNEAGNESGSEGEDVSVRILSLPFESIM